MTGRREIRHVVRWNRVARCRRHDAQTYFIVWADIRNSILNAVQRHDRLSVLLRNRQQASAFKQLGRTVQVSQKSGDEALNIEVPDWQRTLCSIAEDRPLQLQIGWPGFIAFHIIFGEDPQRAFDKIAGIAHEFALHRTRAVQHRSRSVPPIAGNF